MSARCIEEEMLLLEERYNTLMEEYKIFLEESERIKHSPLLDEAEQSINNAHRLLCIASVAIGTAVDNAINKT